MAEALLSLLMVIGLTMGPGRCQNKSDLCFGDDSYFTNVKPNSRIIDPISSTPGIMESTCVNQCRNTLSCSSIFFEQTSGNCYLYNTVFAVKGKMVPSPNTSHFRVVSGERCPIEKCYYMSREYGLCLAFFEGTVPATYNYTMSRKVCEDNHGRLANLENKDKTMWVARMIEVNTKFPASLTRSYVGALATSATSKPINYFWSNGQLVANAKNRSSFWAPNSYLNHTDEPCVFLGYKGLQPLGAWEDSVCSFKVNNVICEFVP